MTQNSNKNFFANEIEKLIAPLCLAEDMELVHTECVPDQKGMTVRIFMDKRGGITIEDCAYMSRQIGDLIDVYLENIGSYRLEVSSPGPERPLKKKDDFQRFKGNRVCVETVERIDGRKKFTGILKGISNNVVELSIDRQIVEIHYGQIRKAKIALANTETMDAYYRY